MARPTLRLARGVVRLASTLAPADRRARMVEEWRAELAREDARGGRSSLVRASLGAFADAWAMRSVQRTESGTMGEGLGGVVREVRLAVRGLLRAPGFTAVAVLTLAVGLGSSAAVYTLLDRVVLDPLPYPEPEGLVRLANQVPGVGPDAIWNLSTAQYVFFTDEVESLAEVGLYRGSGANVLTASGPIRTSTIGMTPSVLSILGARTHLGRLVTEADAQPEAAPVALLDHGFWTRALGADPDIVGTSLSFNGEPTEVVGVLDPEIELPGWPPDLRPDAWIPLRIDRNGSFGNSHVFPAIGRLADGATVVTVEAEIERITPRLSDAFPNAYAPAFFERYGFRTTASPLKDDVLGDMSGKLWILFAGVGLLLLVAATNVINVFLVRIESRGRELSVRQALGARRGAIARHVVAESLTLALLGGALGLAVGWVVVPLLVGIAPAELPRVNGAVIGIEAIVFTLATSIAIGLGIAAYPIFARGGTGDASSLVSGERGGTAGPRKKRLRGALVVSQIALAMSLLVGAGLLLDSMRTLRGSDPGFTPEGVLAVDLYASPARYPDDVSLWGFHREVLERVRALPGVVEAGMGEELPVSGGFGCTVQGFQDETVYARMEDAGMTTCAGQVRVAPGYFEALGIPLLEGRYLDQGDLDQPTRGSVVVSRAFAERFWPGEDALGKGIGPSGRTVEPFYRVVGVVDDVAKRAASGQPPLAEKAVAVYYPGVYNPDERGNGGFWWPGNTSLVVKAEGTDPSTLFPAIREIVREIDPEVPVANARSMPTVVAGAMADLSFLSTLLVIAAVTGLLLAAVGLYGVVSYIVTRRSREIGMRLAIGAAPSEVVRSVVAQTLGLAVGGLVVGIPLALFTSRAGRSALVGVEPTAPAAYVVAALAVIVVAGAAAWLPARRAAAIDPVESLRAE